MIPIILSAGRGSRVGKETQDLPKWFLEIGDKRIHDYQLDALSTRFDTVYLVLGHGFVDETNPDDIVPNRTDIEVVPIVFNEWKEVDNAGSALFALEAVPSDEDLLLICGDVIINEEVVDEFISKYEKSTDSESSAVAAFEGIQDEKTAVTWDSDRYILDYGTVEGHEEAGIFILNETHIDIAENMWSNNLNDWFPIIFPEVRSKAITICNNSDSHYEINTEEDLQKAREILVNNKIKNQVND
jgi:NDP-sugar pyrophosphorylase family protein